MGAVTVRATTASLHLSYQLVAGEGSAVAVDEVVNLRSTETSLGGIRRWFACPRCNRRSRILYAGLASAAGCAIGCRTNPNSKAGPSAPTGVPARSGGALAGPTA